MARFGAEHRTHQLPNAEQIRYVLCLSGDISFYIYVNEQLDHHIQLFIDIAYLNFAVLDLLTPRSPTNLLFPQ